MEVRRLDKSGVVQTDDRVIFLTFDDWGSDESINKLLYVLRKHDVYGTFFIITRTVVNNPNLLRTIAAEGNEIANHSDKHRPMVFVDPQTGKQIVFQTTKDEYVQELKSSYKKLLDIAGDVVVDGKYALTRYFRPPQLAINKHGMEAVFEAGFQYVVSGHYSTKDYAAEDTSVLVKSLMDGIYDKRGRLQKGSILVMHMSDTSPYTPIALDILLTANAAKADSDPTKFRVGRLSDYLTNGYIQKRSKRQPE
jgi:peptidoglycan/xylan/chitin deacetylase (PgdA/CDA1 family)